MTLRSGCRRGAGSGLGSHLGRRGVVAFAADHDGVHVVVASGVVQHQRCAFRAGEPAVAPGRHGGEDRVGVTALLCEPVLVARRVRLVLDPAQQALVHEPVETSGEDVASDTERLLEVVEPASAETGLTDEQQVPVVAEHRRTAGDGARPVGGVGALHALSLEETVASWNVKRLRFGSMMESTGMAASAGLRRCTGHRAPRLGLHPALTVPRTAHDRREDER